MNVPGGGPAAVMMMGHSNGRCPRNSLYSDCIIEEKTVVLQKKDNEGFGFVLRGAKGKSSCSPPGGIHACVCVCVCVYACMKKCSPAPKEPFFLGALGKKVGERLTPPRPPRPLEDCDSSEGMVGF